VPMGRCSPCPCTMTMAWRAIGGVAVAALVVRAVLAMASPRGGGRLGQAGQGWNRQRKGPLARAFALFELDVRFALRDCQWPSALTISSVIFLASPNSIMVLSR